MPTSASAPASSPAIPPEVSYLPLATTIVGIVGAAGVAVLAHRLSKRREALARLAMAAAKFRAAVEASVAQVPLASKHWDNKLLSVLQSIVSGIGLAVAEFKPFLHLSDQSRLDAEWQAFKKHCEERIPQALSASEVLYGGGAPVAQGAKEPRS